MTDELLIDIKDHIATLTLNRPKKKNSLSINILNGLKEFFTDLPEGVRCVVLRGMGEEAFSSGFDITTIGTLSPGDEVSIIDGAYSALQNCPVPTIAYLNGYGFGAGCDLMVSCDFRIAHSRGKFGMPPAKLGVIYSFDGLARFNSLVGPSKAKEIFLVGRYYSAQESYEMGLVSHVIDPQEQEAYVYKMATDIVNNAPLSVTGMKQMLIMANKRQPLSAEDAANVDRIITGVYTSEDMKEGKASFLEKRKPVFKGK